MAASLPDNDAALTALMCEKLFTAVVGDVLDQMGFRRQFLPFGVSPLNPRHRIAGRAMTVLEADVFDDAHGGAGPLATKPFGLLFKALDDLKPGEIYIANAPSLRYALWGGLMTLRAQHLGAAGAILDGCVRDTDEIAKLGFPVFARGLYAQDQGPRGKVIDWRCPLDIGGVRIMPGDLIFADREGVLVIPKTAEREALSRALEKVATENKVAQAIGQGMSTEQAFKTFGVM